MTQPVIIGDAMQEEFNWWLVRLGLSIPTGIGLVVWWLS